MKASTRLLITATTLAALTMLGPAATAAVSVPTPPGGQQHPTTVESGTGPQPGHGAQLHHDAHDTDPATTNQSSNDATTSADYAFAPSTRPWPRRWSACSLGSPGRPGFGAGIDADQPMTQNGGLIECMRRLSQP